MEILKINPGRPAKGEIEKVIKYLKQGKVIVYPTETFYGLGCDATKPRAIAKIYKIKGRGKNKALPFLVAGRKMAEEYLVFNRTARQLAKKYWPGSLSLVLPLNRKGKKIFKRTDGGVRISSNKFAAALVKKLGKPLISTSANPTGRPAVGSAAATIKYFRYRKLRPDLIIDAGKLAESKGSTFVSLTGNKPVILRQGDIKITF